MGVRRSVPAYVVVLALSFLVVAASVPALARGEQPATQNSITVLTIIPNPAQVGQTVNFTAKVTGAVGISNIPTGTITFTADTGQLGTATLDSTGTGKFSTSTLAEGTYNVVAQYSGDANFNPSVSQTITLKIVPQGTQMPSLTTLKIAPDPAMLGQTITFTARVSGSTGVIGQGATGTVTFFEGTNQLGTATLDASSSASITDANLALGTYSITAMYSGDGTFAPSTSPAVRLDVVPVGQLTPTTTLVTSSAPNGADFGTTITFTATVSAGFGSPPTGTVTFNDGSAELGMGTLNNGVATFSTGSLTAGTHSITGVYSGDSTFAGSTSPVFLQTVNNSTSPLYILTVNPTTINVSQGNSGTANVTLTPSGGFNQTVTFLCSGLPIYSQCSFSPSTITPDGSNTPTTIVMTVSTNVATALLLRPNLRGGGAVLAVFSMGLLGLVQVRGKRYSRGRTRLGRYATWFLFLACVGIALSLVACGGSSGNNRVLTPKGMTTVTIAGSTSTGAQTTSFTLNVQ